MSKIDDKHAALRASGLDLGAAVAAEENAHSGGRVRRYERGHIYYHPNTGAHEVHGGILGLYLANGGPGPSPRTGVRELGYPRTDEIPGKPPRSLFEWGEIFWTSGTGGCILSGAIWGRYRQGPAIGLPITSNIPIAGGQAAFFERGAIYTAHAGGKHRVITGHLTPPLLGQPQLIDIGQTPPETFRLTLRWALMMKEDHDALVAMRPSVFRDILEGRYSVNPVGKPEARIAMPPGTPHTSGTFQKDVTVPLSVVPGGAAGLADRTLHDLRCALPNGNHYTLSPHCFYTKKSWAEFGLLHVTDIHISKRNDSFRAKLAAAGLSEAANGYSNFQDNFRDFIRYANKLHGLGMADAVMATGDLIDYVKEDGDSVEDNFERLYRLVLGRPFGPGAPVGEELRIPIFTTLGNHDYRVHPYDLRANIDVPFDGNDKALNEYSSQNLIESDAIALQGGHTPTYGLTDAEDALRMLWTDQAENAYGFFLKHFTPNRDYVVRLGRNRIVMLDTKMDEGVPGLINSALLLELLTDTANESTTRLLSGTGPNSVGFGEPQIAMLRGALGEAGPDGLVIVGMHAPAISPRGGEYPFYFRETVHPTADPALTAGYISRNGLNGSTWSASGTGYFKRGTTEDGLNVGIGWNYNREFLELCAGVGAERSVDLILCGHVHNWVEYRLRHNGELEYYMDFYTENPKVFYPTRNLAALSSLPHDAKIAVQIVTGAPLPAAVGVVRDHRGSTRTESVPVTQSGRVRVPPYAHPLENATNPKAWWRHHRPIHAQTSSLGPIESRQRYGTFYRITNPPQHYRPVIESDRAFLPGTYEGLTPLPAPFRAPTFQGFRLIQVKENVIQKMRYIQLAELRQNGFTMPWEPWQWPIDRGVVIGGGVFRR